MSDKFDLPIFPLSGTILFPETNLPLNIFEKRYLNMVDFVLSTNKKFGIIQPKNNDGLYKIGCIGKIISYEETSDGRYLINILGEQVWTSSHSFQNSEYITLTWNGKNQFGQYVSNGIYFVKARGKTKETIHKIILIKK